MPTRRLIYLLVAVSLVIFNIITDSIVLNLRGVLAGTLVAVLLAMALFLDGGDK